MVKISKSNAFQVIAILILCHQTLYSQQNSTSFNQNSLFIILFLLFVALSINLFIRLIRLRKEYSKKLKENLFNSYNQCSESVIIFNSKYEVEFNNEYLKNIYNVDFTGKNIKEIINLTDLQELINNQKGKISLFDGTTNKAELIDYEIFNQKLFIILIKSDNLNKIFDKYHSLVTNSSDGFYIFNNEGKLVLWNKGAELITGYNAEELFGETFWNVFEKLDYDNIASSGLKSNLEILFKQAIETEDIPELNKLTEKTIIDKNGNLKIIQERCFILLQNGSKYFCCSFRDFTDRKKLEESLFESEKKFRLMFDSLPVAVFEADLQGELNYLNRRGFELLDTNLEQFNNKINVYDFLDEENTQILIRKIRENYRNKKNSYFLLNINNLKGKKLQLIILVNIFIEQGKSKILGIADEVDNLSRFIAVQNESVDYSFIYNSLPYFISFGRLKDQTFYEVNRAFVEFLGINKSEIIGKNTFELKIFDSVNTRREFYNQLNKNNEVKNFRFTYNHPELGKRLLSIDSKIVDYNNQKFLLSITKDITELEDYLTSLEESEYKYRSIFELTPDIIAILQTDGIVLDINQRFEDFTGISTDKIIGNNIFEFPIIDDTDKKIIQSNFKARINGKKVSPYKITIRHINGTTKTGIVYGSIIKNEYGNIDKIMIIISDITELDKAQEEIKSKQLLLENITNTTPMSIYIFNYHNWEFIWHNKSIFELLGYDISKVNTFDLKNLYEYIHPDDLKLFMDLFNRKIDISQGYEFELRLKNPSNKWSWIYTKLTPFKFSEDENIEQMLGISYDITKQKETEEYLKRTGQELRELNATKDKFFTIISHDLRNPISSFLGLSELLYTSDDLMPEEIQAYGKSINDSAHKLYELLENLLQWAKIQTGQFKFEPQNFNLKELVEDINMIFAAQLHNKNIRLLNKIPDSIVVSFDRNIASTILRNLVSNAIKFSHPKSEIIISSEIKGKFVEVAVQDFGVGMPENVKNNLFKIDKIQSYEGTANEKGSGIGLLIVRDFLKSQNCEWDIISKQGEGTIFMIKLPLQN